MARNKSGMNKETFCNKELHEINLVGVNEILCRDAVDFSYFTAVNNPATTITRFNHAL